MILSALSRASSAILRGSLPQHRDRLKRLEKGQEARSLQSQASPAQGHPDDDSAQAHASL
jgi:hypothetical protein